MKSKLRGSVVVVLCVLAIAHFSGCGSSGGTGDTDVTTQDIYRVVTTGESVSFNNLTGGSNDLRLNPVTNLPAVAYYDKSMPVSGALAVGALKYAYMGSDGNWNIEIIDANHGNALCGVINSYCVGAPNTAVLSTNNILRLAFKSDGNPAIAYVFGPSLGGAGSKQIRLAERLSNGTWRVSVAYARPTTVGVANVAIATYDGMKGVTLNFDASDRPHITYVVYTQTAANSQLEYIFRDTGGNWTNNVIQANMLTAPGTLAAVGQGVNQQAATMCPANGMLIGTSMLVDTIAGLGDPLYFRCTALAASGACSTWSVVNMNTGCGGSCWAATMTAATTAGNRTDIIVDPATGRPMVGIYATATPATSLLTAILPNACEVAQPAGAGSWGTPVTVAAGSAGINGFRLAASSTQRYLSYLTLTTNVMLSVFNGVSWFATGHLVETTTVAGEGVGLDYDSTNDLLYTSYASLPAGALGAVGNDLKVGVARPGDLASAGAAGTLPLEFVDSTLSAFPATVVPMLTANKAPDGTVGYAYLYQDPTAARSKLYYGARSGSSANPTFSQRLVANFADSVSGTQMVGSYPSLAYDANSNPVIAFYNGVTGQQQLIVARSNNAGVSFSISVVDDISADVGQFTSVAVSGTTVAVAYYDVTNTGLKYARYTPTSGWRRFTVDGAAGTGSCGSAADDSGRYAVLKMTSDGKPVIAYQSNGANLKLAIAAETADSSTFTWTCGMVEAAAATRAEGLDLVLDTSDKPHIVHFDATVGNVRYATCSSAVGTCITTGPVAYTASLVGATGITTSIVTKPTLKLGDDGTLYSAFHSSAYQALILATLPTGGTEWTQEFIDRSDVGGSFLSTSGQYGVLMLNDSGYPMAFYRSKENWLKYFSREPM